MKLLILRLFIDRFALIANLTNPLHVRILHLAKNIIFVEMGRIYRTRCEAGLEA